jgi:UDP-N-acetylglucosamine 4,6-dehydratase
VRSELNLVNRHREVFNTDYSNYLSDIKEKITNYRILIIGGAGSIGSEVVKILFDLSPKALHVLDINENSLADLVRIIRSSSGYVTNDFLTMCYNPLHPDSDELIKKLGPYDMIMNFAAVKHVRSEKDPFTLMRMFETNIHLMKKLTYWAELSKAKVLFSVSTDKAANPANLMGASKRLMEMTGFSFANEIFSSARFANVAFSNGSLLKAFYDRINSAQPISAPLNIKRFFITHKEAARLCLLEALVANNGTIAIPKAPGEIELTSFVDVATNVLKSKGFTPLFCTSEEEARTIKYSKKEWPCYFFESDTSGEKPFEEFIAKDEKLGKSSFEEINLITDLVIPGPKAIEEILRINPIRMPKEEIVGIINSIIPGFSHIEKGRNLDQRM